MVRDGSFRPTDAQAAGYAERKAAEAAAAGEVEVARTQAIDHTIQSGIAVIRELINGAKTNPLLGVVVSAVSVDVLEQAKVIRPNTATFLFTCIGVAFGVTVALETADAVTSAIDAINPFKSGPAPPDPAGLIKPVSTTFVEGSEAGAPATAKPTVPAGALMEVAGAI